MLVYKSVLVASLDLCSAGGGDPAVYQLAEFEKKLRVIRLLSLEKATVQIEDAYFS